MRCLGRTKESNWLKGCSRTTSFLFCWQHIWQPFIAIVALIVFGAAAAEFTGYSLRDIGTATRSQTLEDIDDENKTVSKEKKKSAPRIPLSKEKIEISIQLSNESKGFSEVYLNENKANLLPNSTPNNPRIFVTSDPQKVQIVKIVTNAGDTCILERIFDVSNIKNFPLRFTPDCQ